MDYTFHPYFVHFTIALFSTSFLFDLIGLLFKKKVFHQAAWYNLIIAGLATILSVVTGLIEEGKSNLAGSAHETLEAHQTLAFIVSIAIFTQLLWRIGQRGNYPERPKFLYIVIGFIGFILLLLAALKGGDLVYKHGIGVQKEQIKQKIEIHSGNKSKAISSSNNFQIDDLNFFIE